MKNKRGFTLVELLVTVALISIVATVTTLVLNPAELLRQARDSDRLNDLTTLHKAVAQYKVALPNNSIGALSTVYISFPDANADCSSYTNLPRIPSGWFYACKPEATYRSINGTDGWLPIDFTDISAPGGVPFSALPVDRTNQFENGLYYTFTLADGDPEN
jgi:prepilin-type N-terminal cleavage/methylation domain-containing protein